MRIQRLDVKGFARKLFETMCCQRLPVAARRRLAARMARIRRYSTSCPRHDKVALLPPNTAGRGFTLTLQPSLSNYVVLNQQQAG